jgi:hypothetical protein
MNKFKKQKLKLVCGWFMLENMVIRLRTMRGLAKHGDRKGCATDMEL